jgi:hypothetical protein
MIVYLLTEQQYDDIIDLEYQPNQYFNPILDDDSRWVISTEEVNQCDINWVKNLPQIEYKPKPNPQP